MAAVGATPDLIGYDISLEHLWNRVRLSMDKAVAVEAVIHWVDKTVLVDRDQLVQSVECYIGHTSNGMYRYHWSRGIDNAGILRRDVVAHWVIIQKKAV